MQPALPKKYPAWFCLGAFAWLVFTLTRMGAVVFSPGGESYLWLWPHPARLGLALAGAALACFAVFWLQTAFLARRGLAPREAAQKAALAWAPSLALLLLPLGEFAFPVYGFSRALAALGRELWVPAGAAALAWLAFATLAGNLGPFRPLQGKRRALAAWAVFAAAFCIFAAVGLRFGAVIQKHGPFWGGDEPSYLLQAHSLAMDRDLDLTNNIKNRDARHFLKPGRTSDGHARKAPGGGMYSPHRPGLSLLIAPAYRLALGLGKNPRKAALFVMWLFAAWLISEVFLSSLKLTVRTGASLAAAGAACLLPVLHYSNTLFPEIAAGAFAACAWRLLGGRDALGLAAALGAGLLCAALPWLHERFLPLSAVLVLIFLLRGPKGGLARLGFFAPLVLSLTLLAAYFQLLYGHPWPTAGVHAQGSYLNPRGVWEGLAGLWLDGAEGLLPQAPFWLAGLAGMLILLRKKPGPGWGALALAGAVYLVAGLYADWFGGINPPARYLVSLTPFAAVGLAAGLAWGPKCFAPALAGLAAWGVMAAGLMLVFPIAVYGHKVTLDAASQFAMARAWLPTFILPGKGAALNYSLALVWGLVCLLGLAFLVRKKSGPAKSGGLVGLGLVFVALGAAALAADRLGPGLGAAAGPDQKLAAMRRVAALGPKPLAGPQGGGALRGINLPLPPGRYAHPPAKRGRAGVTVPATGKPMLVVWGQYLDLPPGNYRVRARAQASGGAVRFRLEASRDWGRGIIGKDLCDAPPEGSCALAFRLETRTKGVEIRLGTAGGPSFLLKSMDLEYLLPL